MNGRMGSCCFRICVEEGDEEESVVVVNRVEPGKLPQVRSFAKFKVKIYRKRKEILLFIDGLRVLVCRVLIGQC